MIVRMNDGDRQPITETVTTLLGLKVERTPTSSGLTMLQLRYEEHGVAKVHRLSRGLTLIGRLPTCDLVLLDPSVSRHHASLRVVDPTCRLAGCRQPLRHLPRRAEVRGGDVA